MALPTTTPTSSWLQSLSNPSQLFGTGRDDYELYEQDGEFVLSVEMPGFDHEDVEVTWHEGRLHVAAEREDEHRNQRRTYRRSFRLPKEIDDDAIAARYRNGVLEITLPTVEGATTRGKTIPVEG
jgi:HSP20 family protein